MTEHVAARPRATYRSGRGASGVNADGAALLRHVAIAAAFVACLPIPIARFLPPGISRPWYALVIGLFVVALVLGKVRRPSGYGYWLLAGCLCGAAGIASSASAGLSANLRVAVPLALLWLLGPLALRWLYTEHRSVFTAGVVGFSVSQSASALAAVRQATGGEVLGYSALLGRSPGLATHPNLLGIMGGMVVVLMLDRLVVSRAHAVRYGAVLVLNLAALILSGSISAMMATTLGAVSVIVVRRVKVTRLLVATFSLILITVVGFQALNPSDGFRDPTRRFQQVTGQTGEQSSLDGRVGLMSTAIERIKERPLSGSGMTDAFASVNYRGTYVHNFVLRSWMQGGLLLATAAITLLLGAAWFVLTAVRTRSHAAQAAIVVLVLGFSLTSTVFDSVYYWLPVVAAWAAGPAGRLVQPKAAARPGRINRHTRWDA